MRVGCLSYLRLLFSTAVLLADRNVARFVAVRAGSTRNGTIVKYFAATRISIPCLRVPFYAMDGLPQFVVSVACSRNIDMLICTPIPIQDFAGQALAERAYQIIIVSFTVRCIVMWVRATYEYCISLSIPAQCLSTASPCSLLDSCWATCSKISKLLLT